MRREVPCRGTTHLLVDPFLVVLPDDIPQLGDEVVRPVLVGTQQLGAPQARIDLLALGYIAARIAYIALYLADRASLRSAVFMVGFLLNVALLFAGWH